MKQLFNVLLIVLAMRVSAQDYVSFYEEGSWGIKNNKTGKVVLKPNYDWTKVNKSNYFMYPVLKKGTTVIFITDFKGKEVYSHVEVIFGKFESDSLLVIKDLENRKSFFVDRQMKQIGPDFPEKEILVVNHNLLLSSKNKEVDYDKKIKTLKNGSIFNSSGEKLTDFNVIDKDMIFQTNNFYGWVNPLKGELTFPAEYDRLTSSGSRNTFEGTPFRIEKLYLTKNNLKGEYSPSKGKFIVPVKYKNIVDIAKNSHFSGANIAYGENGILLCTSDSVLFESGEIIYEREFYFNDDKKCLLAVSKNKKRGYIDIYGNVILPLEYDSLARITNKLIKVYQDKKFGFIDYKTGNSSGCIFTEGEQLTKNLNLYFLKNDKGYWGKFDLTNLIVDDFKYENIVFEDDFIKGKTDQNLVFIDKKTLNVVASFGKDQKYIFLPDSITLSDKNPSSLTNKTTMSYDKKGNISNINWAYSYKRSGKTSYSTEYIYNANSKLSKFVEKYSENEREELKIIREIFYAWLADGKLSSISTKVHNEFGEFDVQKVSYNWAGGKISMITDESKDDTEIPFITKETFNYPAKNIIEIVLSDNNGLNRKWRITGKKAIFYNTQGKIEKFYSVNSYDGKQDTAFSYKFSYDSSGYLVRKSGVCNSHGEKEDVTYQLNSFGFPTSISTKYVKNTSEIEYKKTTMEYTKDGLLTDTKSEYNSDQKVPPVWGKAKTGFLSYNKQGRVFYTGESRTLYGDKYYIHYSPKAVNPELGLKYFGAKGIVFMYNFKSPARVEIYNENNELFLALKVDDPTQPLVFFDENQFFNAYALVIYEDKTERLDFNLQY